MAKFNNAKSKLPLHQSQGYGFSCGHVWMSHELTAKKKQNYVLKCHLLIYATTRYFSIGL